jgi:hypothetical protein
MCKALAILDFSGPLEYSMRPALCNIPAATESTEPVVSNLGDLQSDFGTRFGQTA